MKGGKVIHDPRKAVLRQLARAHDRFAEEEQVMVAVGRYDEAQVAHDFALWVLRAYTVEMDNPIPEGLE